MNEYSLVLSQFSGGKWENFTILPLCTSGRRKDCGLIFPGVLLATEIMQEPGRSHRLTSELVCFVN